MLRTGQYLNLFPKLQTLILDKNQLASVETFPRIPELTTLWLNNNLLDDLKATTELIATKYPNLTYLSMIMNPCCPNIYLFADQADAYQRYRYFIISRLPKLQLLDSTAVTPQERLQATNRNSSTSVAKPTVDESKFASGAGSKRRESASNNFKPKVGSFLATSRARYDGTNSEGNRFIGNDDL